MNIALIIAGGNGQRMNQEVPKQFLNVRDKPIIVYTLEAFERHPEIHEIGVSCLEGWNQMLAAYAREYNITKLKWICDGGLNGQDSIRSGALEAERRYGAEDILLIHDAIRPLVSQEIISDCIVQCQKHGSAVAVLPCNSAALLHLNGQSSQQVVPRWNLAITQTPQGFPVKKLADAHREALEKGITNSVATCTMFVELGQEVFFSVGSEANIKITTQDDMSIFRAMLEMREKVIC
jgi:2-C-methyl-D-erythritol 4-phosphate cytidylyltransferase